MGAPEKMDDHGSRGFRFRLSRTQTTVIIAPTIVAEAPSTDPNTSASTLFSPGESVWLGLLGLLDPTAFDSFGVGDCEGLSETELGEMEIFGAAVGEGVFEI